MSSDVGRTVVSSLKWMAVGRFSGQIFSWAATIVVMRRLEPHDYGIMALSMAVIGLVTLLNEFGIGSALVQRPDLDEQMVGEALSLLFAVNFAIYTIVYVSAPAISHYYREGLLVDTLRVLGLSFLMVPFINVPSALLNRDMRFKPRAAIDLSTSLLRSVVTLVLAFANFGVWALIAGFLVGQLSTSIGLRIVGARPSPRLGFARAKLLLGFSSWMVGIRVLWYLYINSATFIIGKVLGPQALGAYSVAYELSTLPMQKVTGIINLVTFSAYSKLQADRARFLYAFEKGVRLLSAISFPVFFGISCVGPEIVKVFLGSKWAAAIFPIQLLSLIVPLNMLSNMFAPAVAGLGFPRATLKYTLAGCIIMPAAVLIGTRFGLNGVAIGWVLAYPVLFVITAMCSLPVVGLSAKRYIACFIRPAVAAGMMLLAVEGYKRVVPGTWTNMTVLVSAIVVGVAVYVAGMLVIDRGTSRQLVAILR